ncbi:HAD family hydrolase [Yoonia sp. R2331]|uniref:HAD family hydrolase n=1 Tax=Yoonia sp. R2331 TaxID=3237238 RepID=UPI0034E60F74
MIEYVLMLDVDGVLVTAGPNGGSWSDQLEADLGIPKRDLLDAFFHKYWAEIIIGKAEMMPMLEAALDEIGTEVSATALRDYWFAQDATLNTDMLREVAEIRAAGVPVWLATNQEHLRAAYLLDDLGLGDMVDGAIWSAAVGAKKPDPAFFAAVEARVGKPQATFVFVDDRLPNVEAARACGWVAHHWTGDQSLRAVFDAV